MKKPLIAILAIGLFASSCKKTNDNNISFSDDGTAPVGRVCASQEVLTRQLAEDPSLADRMSRIEQFQADIQRNSNNYRLVNGIVEIPVVVNVLYATSAQNISDAQIQSQITVLNKDFAATNTDYSKTPSIFQNVRSGDTKIRFVLQEIVRKASSKSSWKTDDAMKKSQRGGINPTNPSTTLNLWSCNMSGGILGYAQFPGGNLSTDGIVIDDNAFGSTGSVSAPYNLGRTATHEVGHWLNLRHIWGDANCGSDLIDDTPTHNTANYGCPTANHRSTCSGTPVEMTMNYMDYTDDPCMYMFTAKQNVRMQATFAAGGGRNSFAQP